MRKAVLMKALEDIDVEEGFDWREVAVMTEGYSCGDVVELCREVRFGSMWRPSAIILALPCRRTLNPCELDARLILERRYLENGWRPYVTVEAREVMNAAMLG